MNTATYYTANINSVKACKLYKPTSSLTAKINKLEQVYCIVKLKENYFNVRTYSYTGAFVKDEQSQEYVPEVWCKYKASDGTAEYFVKQSLVEAIGNEYSIVRYYFNITTARKVCTYLINNCDTIDGKDVVIIDSSAIGDECENLD